MIEHSMKEEITTLKFKGRLDAATAADAEKKIADIIAGDNMKVLLDMSELSYISSAGLRLVLMLGKKIKTKGGKLVLASLQLLVKEVFQMTGFYELFEITPDLNSAEMKLRE